MSNKICNKCRQEKDTNEFHTYRKNGEVLYRGICKACRNQYTRERRTNLSVIDREKERKYKRQYRASWSEERKKCELAKRKRWRSERKEHYKFLQLKQRYGLSKEAYNRLLAEQNNACAICNTHNDLVVDHNHQTGAVRGLLCFMCNSGLGSFIDDPLLLTRAIEYLRAHQSVSNEKVSRSTTQRSAPRASGTHPIRS